MDFPSTPKLPAALVAALTFVGIVLDAAGASLPSPWHEISLGVLAVLGILGVPVAHRAVTAHGQRVADHITSQTSQEGASASDV